jgi:type IV pilus assembly protein PilC
MRGKIIKGFLNAETEVDLSNKISNMGYFMTGFKLAQGGDVQSARFKTYRMNSREVLQFTFQLNTLIDAGLPLLEGLRDLVQSTSEERVKRVLEDIRYRIESGGSLKDSLSLHPHSFSKLYTAIVGAGEATGKLPQALNDLSDLLEWQMELGAKIKEAATYPVILFTVMIGVVTILVVKVIPMFKPIFDQADVALPLPTQFLLNFSEVMRTRWYYFIAVGAAIFGASVVLKTFEKGRFLLDTIKLKLPLFGGLIRKIALSRFTHTFALCFRAGINLLSCLDISKDTCSNLRIEKAIGKARDSVNVGEKLAGSLQATGEFPVMVVRMIGVGEQSGALVNTLTKVAGFYDKEVASTIKKIFSLFEPIMIVIMGVIVGGIAFAIFLPIFKMSQMVGG